MKNCLMQAINSKKGLENDLAVEAQTPLIVGE
jgi:hypothetical protein